MQRFHEYAWWIAVFPGVRHRRDRALGFSLLGDGLAELLRTKK